MSRQAYLRYHGLRDWCYREIEVLPKCKIVEKHGGVMEYQLVRRKIFFGLIPWTYWLEKHNIRWYDKPSVKYYTCSVYKNND